jgi:hypothetical protein
MAKIIGYTQLGVPIKLLAPQDLDELGIPREELVISFGSRSQTSPDTEKQKSQTGKRKRAKEAP